MSIASEITRLQGVKADILHAISNKGVTVPAGAGLDDVAGLIDDIPTGSPDIPDGYIKLLYIYSSGGANAALSTPQAGIFEPVKLSDEIDILISTKGLNNGFNNQIDIYNWTVNGSNYNSQIYVTAYNNKSYLQGHWATIYQDKIGPDLNYSDKNFWNIIVRGSQVIINGNSYSQYAANFPANIGTMFFSNGGHAIEIYHFVIKSNGKEKYNFVPAKRISDNKCGLLETHTGTFLSSVNGREYLAGPFNQ